MRWRYRLALILMTGMSVVCTQGAQAASSHGGSLAPNTAFAVTLQGGVAAEDLDIAAKPLSARWQYAGWVLIQQSPARLVAGGIRVQAAELAGIPTPMPVVDHSPEQLPAGRYELRVIGDQRMQLAVPQWMSLRKREAPAEAPGVSLAVVAGPTDAYATKPVAIKPEAHIVFAQGSSAARATSLWGQGCPVIPEFAGVCAVARSAGAAYNPFGSTYSAASASARAMSIQSTHVYEPGDFTTRSLATRQRCSGAAVTKLVCFGMLLAVNPHR